MKHSNRAKRRSIQRTLRDIFGSSHRSTGARAAGGLRLESLEGRLLLAGDTMLDVSLPTEQADTPVVWQDWSDAEGEETPAVDLVAFAQALTAANVRLFGAAWCPTCTTQKELFEDGAHFLPFIECSDIDRQPNAEAIANNITAYPTWIFPDNSREVGFMTLEAIASRSGVTIPTSVSPFVAPIEDTIVLDGSPLHVALDGYDPNGGPLTYTVTSSNESIVTATVLTGNRSAAIDFAGWGEIVVQLFEQRAPRATSRFIELAESGFYDAANNDPDVTAHRVKDDFMMQFGDPNGTGSGGSSLGDFDDQFHPDLQHNTPGIISYAKSNDDTNDSQVFIIDAPTRHLDFNHSVFGLVTEGDSVRDAITAVKTNADTWRPQFAVNIESVSIFNDTENGVVMLKAAEGATGTATITVTVSDVEGHTYTEQFDVTVQPDTWNGGPYLEDIGPITTTSDQPAVFQLSAIDVEGDAVTFGGVKSGSVNYTLSVDSSTGEVSVTPPTGYVGEMSVTLYVRPATTSDTGDVYDVQEVSILVTPAAPQSVDLVSSSDSGASDTDNVTNATTLQFLVEGVTNGAQVRLHQGNTIIGTATASGTSVTITTSSLAAAGDGTYNVYATQVVDNEVSPASTALGVTIDTTAPAALTSTPPTSGNINVPISYDAQSPDEGTTGTIYSLQGAPAAAAIDPDTGVLAWTPGIADVGPQNFTIVLTDLAGNARTQAISLDILSDAVVGFRLEVTDKSGNPISSIMVGEQFDLRVYVADVTAQPSGVFSAFLDVLYNQQLVMTDGNVTFGSAYPNAHNSNLSTPGLVDEAGGVAGLTDLGGGEFLLFTVPLQAVATGTALFESDAADQLPLHEILRYGAVMDVEADEVLYGSTTLTIDPAFNAVNDTFNVDEDSSATTLTVLNNEQIFQGSTGNLTVVGVSSTSHGGIVTIASDNLTVLYTPAADFFGEDTFTYSVSDGTGTDTATVTVQVMPVNDEPTAVNDAVSVPEDSVNFVLDVLANDLITPDADETLSITSFANLSAGGSLSITNEGDRLLYTPAENFFGTETFTYTISDGNGGTSSATVTVTIVEQNDPPEATNDLMSVVEDSTDNVLNVLANDSTAGDEGETLTIVEVSTPEFGGTVTIAQDGLSLIFTPAANFFGNERFTYKITDGNLGFAEASVTVSVSGTNDPPTANNDAFTVVRDSSGNSLNVLGNDSSAPDATEVLTIVSISSVSGNGAVSVSSDGKLVLYTPAADFSGTESFTYTIRDPSGATAQATATVTVTEFIPSSLSGHVYIDANNNGVRDAGEVPLGGVVITLLGTDQSGASVSETATSDAFGFYEFTELAPGSYQLIEAQPTGLIDGIDRVGSVIYAAGSDTLEIELAQDTDLTECDFGERGRASAGISLVDFFVRSQRAAVLVATASSSMQWYAIEGGWSHAASLSVNVDEAAGSAQLDVITTGSEQYSTTLNLHLASHVQTLSSSALARLFRVVGSPELLFPGAACACAGEAEGESSSSLLSGGDGEGEALTSVSTAGLSGAAVPLIVTESIWADDEQGEGEATQLLPTPWDSHLAADVIFAAESWETAPDTDDPLSLVAVTEGEYQLAVDSILDDVTLE